MSREAEAGGDAQALVLATEDWRSRCRAFAKRGRAKEWKPRKLHRVASWQVGRCLQNAILWSTKLKVSSFLRPEEDNLPLPAIL